ncbi:hypothetical protein [Bosea sp. TAB14]|uniref:hypothetical protein n=1 Tax=Bosea sp. TAB14 TaxID=3237481 RepID=UPI003F93BFE7
MTGEKVVLHGARETLLVTLCAKAGESQLPDTLLKDRFAAQALAGIDYDFDRLRIDRDIMIGVALRDKPAFVIAEGLLPYLPSEEVPLLLERVTGHLPGGELAFDAYSGLGLALLAWQPSIRATGATLHWALDDPEDLLRQLPQLTLAEELTGYGPGGYDLAQVDRMSLFARMAIPVMSMVPVFSRLGRLLRFRF